MAIEFALYENHLTADPDDYRAHVQNQRVRTLDDLIEEMVQPGSAISTTETRAVLEGMQNAVLKFLKQGDAVSLPLFSVKASIGGVFNGRNDSFDPNRHSKSMSVQPGILLQDGYKDAPLQKVEASKRAPRLLELEDVGSNTVNEQLTPGSVATLRGYDLKVDTSDAEQGLSFIAADGTATKVDTYVRNKPSELIFIVPTLPVGFYNVELTIRYGDAASTSTGRMDGTVEVK